MPKKIPSSAAILIGGKSQRFGADKAFLGLKGEPVSVHLAKLLNGVFLEVFFVGGSGRKGVHDDSLVIPDLYPGIGPLGGLATALKYARYPYCFLTACDLPFITTELLYSLWLQSGKFDIVVPNWNGHIEPLVSFYHKRCLAEIHRTIGSGEYMLSGFWQQLKVKYVDMLSLYTKSELEKIFHNINTPEDYQQALTMLEKD